MRTFTPQLYLVDYCSWVVVLVVSLVASLPLLTSPEATMNAILATVIISLTAAACVAIILMRGRRSRRLSQMIARNKGDGVVMSFDLAHLQDREGRLLREIAPAALYADSTGRIEIWQPAPVEPVLNFEAEQIRSVESVHEYRWFCYPTLLVTLNDSSLVRLRPVKQSGVQWRSGMSHRESEAAARRIWPLSIEDRPR